MLLSLGVCLAVVSDVQISANPIGLIISGVAIAFTAVFQVRCILHRNSGLHPKLLGTIPED